MDEQRVVFPNVIG